jgi:Protein of unknown function, DUF547
MSGLEAVAQSKRALELARVPPAEADGGALDEALDALGAVRPGEIDEDAARVAFWLNVYNACLLRELSARPRRGHLIHHRRLFRTAICVVGAEPYALDDIEHGVLRGNRRPPTAVRRRFRRSDPRLSATPAAFDPRIHFALNCGAASCPPIRSYDAERLDRQLAEATRSYFATEASLNRARRILELPGLIRFYRRDFGGRAARVAFAIDQLGAADAEWLRRNLAGVRIRYARFDWTMLPDPI